MVVRRLISAGIMITLAGLALPPAIQAQKLVFIVRHAERADGGAPRMQAQADPLLSPMGEARAAKLAVMLRDAGIQAIYVTEYRRTQDTAKPLATQLGLEPRQYSSRDTDALVRRLHDENIRDIVLVVGHSNTVPAVIKALGGREVALADDEYDNLFILEPGTGVLTRIRFTP
jgi:broad specificity phosphatase PhoE